MSEAVADGLIRAVGVSNYSLSHIDIAVETLSKHGIPLASNQIKYNLLDRRPEKSGLINLCQSIREYCNCIFTVRNGNSDW